MKNNQSQQAEPAPAIFYIYGTAARPHIKGEALAEALEVYSTNLIKEAHKRGALILNHQPAKGYWKGEPEPSFKTAILAGRNEAFHICQALAEAHDQEALMLVEPALTGTGAILSVTIPSSKGTEEAEEAAADTLAYTITGGAVELVTTDANNQAEAEAIAEALEAEEVAQVTGVPYLVKQRTEKQKRKQERKERRREIETGESREEREARETRERAEAARAEAEAQAEKQRQAAEAKRRARRAQEAREALEAIGYSNEEPTEPGRVREYLA